MKKYLKKFTVCLLLGLSACNIPPLFWEEEGIKVAEDVIAEEKQVLENPPAVVVNQTAVVNQATDKKSDIKKEANKEQPSKEKKIIKTTLYRVAHEIRVFDDGTAEIVVHHCSPDPFVPCPPANIKEKK